MEEVQKEHIRNNRSDLINNTKWSTDLGARLVQKGILSDYDVESINACKVPLEQSSQLYILLLTRSDSYKPFISILRATNQSGAGDILEKIPGHTPATPSQHPGRFSFQRTPSQNSSKIPNELIVVVVRLDDSAVVLTQNTPFRFTISWLQSRKYFYESSVEGQNIRVFVISEDLIDHFRDTYNQERTFFFSNELSWNTIYEEYKDIVLQREISLNAQSMSLSDVLSKIGNEEQDLDLFLQNLNEVELLEVLDTSRKIEIGNHLPQVPKHYVPRKLKRNRRLSRRILGETNNPDNKDIFFFQGLDWHELTSLVQKFVEGNTNTDRSFQQLQRTELSVRFILLQQPSHFDKFKDHANMFNLHWLRCEEKSETHEVLKLHWVKTYGSMKTIQRFIHPAQKQLEEMYVLMQEKGFQQPKLISGSPCSGKSTLMASIARKLQSEDMMNFVHIIKIEDFLDELLKKWHDQRDGKEEYVIKQTVDEISSNSEERTMSPRTSNVITCEDINDVLFSLLSKSSVGQKLSRAFLKSTTCQLVCTDFHVLSPERIEYANQLFNFFNKDNPFHLWVTAAPHLVRGLEETLKVLSYTVIPIEENEQIDLIVKSRQKSNQEWKLAYVRNEVTTALTALRASMSNDPIDICAFPMICELFAEVIEPWLDNDNNPITEENRQEFAKYISASTISDLFGKVLASRFELTTRLGSRKFTMSNISDIWQADDNIKYSVYAHMLFAIKQNLPKEVFEKVKTVLKCNPSYETTTDTDDNLLAKRGFLKSSHDRKRVSFIHVCYSSYPSSSTYEYFVALATIEILHLLHLEDEVKTNSNIRDELVGALLAICKNVFATKPIEKRVSMHCNPVGTFQLKNRHICYFLNTLLPTPIKHSFTDPIIITYTTQQDQHQDKISQDLWKVLNALTLESFDKLALPVMECINRVFDHDRDSNIGSDIPRFPPMDNSNSTSIIPLFDRLTFLAARYGKKDMVEIIFEFYQYWSGKSLHALGIQCQSNVDLRNHDLLDKEATILHVAVEAGQYQVVEHLVNKYFSKYMGEEKYTGLLYFCSSSSKGKF